MNFCKIPIFYNSVQIKAVFDRTKKNYNYLFLKQKIKFGNRVEAADGINRTALREIKLLQELKNNYIIGVIYF